jgi:hypothetical protein
MHLLFLFDLELFGYVVQRRAIANIYSSECFAVDSVRNITLDCVGAEGGVDSATDFLVAVLCQYTKHSFYFL